MESTPPIARLPVEFRYAIYSKCSDEIVLSVSRTCSWLRAPALDELRRGVRHILVTTKTELLTLLSMKWVGICHNPTRLRRYIGGIPKVDVVNSAGRTPLDLAQEVENGPAATLLKQRAEDVAHTHKRSRSHTAPQPNTSSKKKRH